MDNEILGFLKSFKEDIDKKFNDIDKRFDSMGADIKDLKSGQDKIFNYLEAVDAKQATNHLEVLNEFKAVKTSVDSIKKDLATVEIVTSSNYADIAKLKAVK